MVHDTVAAFGPGYALAAVQTLMGDADGTEMLTLLTETVGVEGMFTSALALTSQSLGAVRVRETAGAVGKLTVAFEESIDPVLTERAIRMGVNPREAISYARQFLTQCLIPVIEGGRCVSFIRTETEAERTAAVLGAAGLALFVLGFEGHVRGRAMGVESETVESTINRHRALLLASEV